MLKDFCVDAYQELKNIGELPRPRFDAPKLAGEALPYSLSELPALKRLEQYMLSSGLSKRLQDIGHTWLWHYEVFHWLFLERVIAQSDGISLDMKVFDKIFKRASAEISRNSFRFRRITVLNGLPKLNSHLEFQKGVLLFPLDYRGYSLPKLLGVGFQNMNREPPLWVDPDNCLLIQDSIISKGNEGRNILESREQLRHQADTVIKVLRLSLDTPIYPKAVYLSYLSSFPLIPILYKEFEEFSGFSYSIQRSVTKAERMSIRRNFRFITCSVSKKPLDEFFSTALDKFSDSFRGMQEKQSIVDLFIALEAMYRVSVGLRQRLATFTAFLLGTNDNKRRTFYDHIFAGYKLRSAIVHGGKDQEQGIYNALTDFFPELKNKPTNEVVPYLRKTTEELQRIVRLVLRAYVYMRYNGTREEWPNVDDLEYLPFDSTKRRLIQKQLGITAKQPTPPSWHF